MGKNDLKIIVAVGAVAAVLAAGYMLFRNAGASPAAKRAAPPPKASTTTAAPKPWVVAENEKPGTDAWKIAKEGDTHGYADRTSAPQGDTVRLFVSTASPGFTVDAFRMGFYQGHHARLVWTSAQTPGARQAAATVDPATHLGEARWNPSLQVKLDTAAFPPGDYLFKISGSDGTQAYAPLAVRDDASKAPLALINSVTTWQAYNTWGGCSLYECPGGGAKRAVEISFDRPVSYGAGAGDFLGIELPLVSLVEELGIEPSYWTDVDLHERPDAIAGGAHRAVLSLGHDEYYSTAMRNALEKARDGGVNLAFFGANAMYRHIRFDSGPNGTADRRIWNYRSTSDPVFKTDKAETTVEWRSPPVNRPENALAGLMYECAPTHADMVITDASAWMFQGAGVSNGTKLAHLMGDEYDRWWRLPSTPANEQILAHSPVTCGGKNSFGDMGWYSAPSGAGVFDSGTNNWVCGIDATCAATGGVSVDDPSAAKVKVITTNILREFAAGPAGAKYPSQPNANAFYG